MSPGEFVSVINPVLVGSAEGSPYTQKLAECLMCAEHRVGRGLLGREREGLGGGAVHAEKFPGTRCSKDGYTDSAVCRGRKDCPRAS